MPTKHISLTTILVITALWSTGAIANATTYTANSWDCTQSNTSVACAQADLPALPVASTYLTSATGADGFIYAIGGRVGVDEVNTLDAFSIGTGWLPAAAMPTKRSLTAAVSIPQTGHNGYLFVLGGLTGSKVATDVVEVYDTSNNTWGCSYAGSGCSNALYKPLPTPRYALSATLGADGRIYTLGGTDSSGISGVVEAYDRAANTWDCSIGDAASGCASHTLKPLPTARDYAGAATGLDGRIYSIGGVDATTYVRVVESYNPATGTWACSIGDGGCAPGAQTLAPMPTSRGIFSIAKGPDNHIYVFGGPTGAGAMDRVEAYTPDSAGGKWVCSSGDSACAPAAQTLKPMPTARYGTAATLGPDGRIYVIAGRNPNIVSTVEAYTVPASAPTGSRVARVTGTRHGTFVAVRWTLSDAHGVVGFRLYAGQRLLTKQAIGLHAAARYRARIRWSGAVSRLTLHLLLRNGREVEVGVL